MAKKNRYTFCLAEWDADGDRYSRRTHTLPHVDGQPSSNDYMRWPSHCDSIRLRECLWWWLCRCCDRIHRWRPFDTMITIIIILFFRRKFVASIARSASVFAKLKWLENEMPRHAFNDSTVLTRRTRTMEKILIEQKWKLDANHRKTNEALVIHLLPIVTATLLLPFTLIESNCEFLVLSQLLYSLFVSKCTV